jgi:hypothetical protein
MAWAPDYIDLVDFSAFLRVADNYDDDQMAVAITSAARAIDAYCNRQFGILAAPAEWKYTARPDYDIGRWVVTVDDVMTTDGMVVTVDGTTVTDYTLDPPNAVSKGKAWTRIVLGTDAEAQPDGGYMGVAVTALWGWSDVPTSVVNANQLQASRFLQRRDSPYGVAGSPTDGSELRLLSKLDPDVAVSLRGYTRAREVG